MSERDRLDLLLVHTPKLNNFYDPFGYFVMNNVIAWGLFSLADWAEQSGYRARILHLGAEALFTAGFRLGDYLARTQPRVVGLSIHWHYQLHDVCEIARLIKQRFPATAVVVGGYTATLFADDLLRGEPAIDYVIRGEAEEPLAALLGALGGGGDLARVPNLSRRDGAEVRHHPLTFVADRAFLERLTFCRLDLLEHRDVYLGRLSYPLYLRSYPRFLNYSFFGPGRMKGYMVPVGRGCPVECAFCGGSGPWQAAHFGRTAPAIISPERVAADIDRATSFGINSLYFPFDPYPASDYYPRLFRLLRDSGRRFHATFESFRLPTPEFIAEFAATFAPGRKTQIVISPETGDEALRSRVKGYPYDNAELLASLDQLEQRGLHFQLSYSLGLPGETAATLDATRQLWRAIARRYRHLLLQTATLIDFDPGSSAERAGISPRHTLASLREMHRESHRRSWTGWTYLPGRHACAELTGSADPGRTREYLQSAKCREFCPLASRFHLPWPLNRALCRLMGWGFRLIGRPWRWERFS